MKTEYKVFTDKGWWRIDGDTDDIKDALRKALWFCWRDGEEFKYMTSLSGKMVIRIAVISGDDFYTLA